MFSVVPCGKIPIVNKILKSIHARETKNTARVKAQAVAQQLREMKLTAAKKIETGIDETLIYMDYPAQHWNKIRTTNLIERVNREIKRRTRAIGAFPDGQSALMLVCARLRYVSGTDWGAKRYLNMQHLFELEKEEINEQKSTGWFDSLPMAFLNLRKIIDTTQMPGE